MRDDTVLKYTIPAVFVIRGTVVDPLLFAISFGLVAGWLGRIALLYDENKSWREIMRSTVVSVLAGAGGALIAYALVIKLGLDTLGAAIIAFGIAASGVRTIKVVVEGTVRVVDWLMKSFIKGNSDNNKSDSSQT